LTGTEADMSQGVVRKLACAPIPGLLLALTLLMAACSSTATHLSPEPAAVPLRETVPSDHSWAAGTGPGQRIRFERISLEQGLSQGTVYSILQDSKGFMWFATQDGLNKYDGYEFTVYKPVSGVNSLALNFVRVICEDPSGMLWIGTTGGGLDRFDPGTGQFTHYQYDPQDSDSLSSNYVASISAEQSGELWIGTQGGGLNKFDPKTGQSVRYPHVSDNPRSLVHHTVWSVYRDREGVLWIGTENGLDRGDPVGQRFIHYQNDPRDPNSLSGNSVRSIYQDQEGVLWVGTGAGLNRYDRQKDQFARYQHDPDDPNSLSNDSVRAIYQDRDGVLWIGTDDGLNVFDSEAERFVRYQNNLSDPYSLSSNWIWSIYQDREGVLWIGTYNGGINKFDRSAQRFTHYQADPQDPDGLSSNQIWSIYQDQEGILWIGTNGEGLNGLDREQGVFIHYQHDPDAPYNLSHNVVRSVYQDREGVLWVGTEGGGLDRLVLSEAEEFAPFQGRFIHYRHDPDDPYSLSHDVVRVIYQDQEGTLWIGTDDGLDEFDRQSERFTQYFDDASVWSIHKDRQGTLWIGTGAGIYGADRNGGRFHYQNDPGDPHSLSSNIVLSIHQDRSGELWIGTFGGGLNRFDRENRRFVQYREKDGLPSDAVYGILEDAQGFLWLSTNGGLSRFDPRTETFKNYGVNDGLQSQEFRAGAYHKSSSGEMFFGGINGFNAFYPDEIGEDNPYIPPVVLTSLQQANEDVDIDGPIESVESATFRWPNNFFEFEFAALSYAQPEENQYAYMLEGLDKGWFYIGTRRFGSYTNLPGGTYTLRLKGSNNDGVWNERGTSIKITVVPQFWESWWFRGGVILALVGGAIAGYRLRVRGIEARSRELEVQVRERTSQLEALYRADEELYRHLQLDQVLQALVSVAVDLLQADHSAVLVWVDGISAEGQGRWVVQIAHGFSREAVARLYLPHQEGITESTVASGEPIVMENVAPSVDPRLQKQRVERVEVLQILAAAGIRAFMHLPVRAADGTFGLFHISFAEPHTFTQDERRLFLALAQRASLAIENAQLYERAQELAAVEERQRLARDLHDAVTQTLFSASLIAEALPSLWKSNPGQGEQLVYKLLQLSRGALAEMRTLLMELRPAALAEASLKDLLRQLAQAVAGREGIPVIVTVEEPYELPADVHIALYRIAQEALNNVVKHAAASRVEVALRYAVLASGPQGEEPGVRVELCIRDDGCGFDLQNVSPERLGLGIMHERAAAIGARLEIESEPDHGTQVFVVWEGGEG
jgi:ligand-binding sensor domain-containing protein/signal transduction histidine kinase